MALHDLTLVHYGNSKLVDGEQPAYISGASGPILVVCPKTGVMIHAAFNSEKRAYCNTVTDEPIDWPHVSDYYRLFYTG